MEEGAGMTSAAALEQARWAARARSRSQHDGGGGGGNGGIGDAQRISAEYVLVDDENGRRSAEVAGGMGGQPRATVRML